MKLPDFRYLAQPLAAQCSYYRQIGHAVPLWFGAGMVALAIGAILLALPAIRAYRAQAEAAGV